MEIFGFEIKRRLQKADPTPEEENKLKSFVPKYDDEGTMTVAAGGYYGQYYDIDGTQASTDKDLILKYRGAAEQPECDTAIDDIVDEAICSGLDGAPVELNLDDLNYEEGIKEKIKTEFNYITRLLEFNEHGSELFRRWYIDGKIYFHIVVDTDNPKLGIQELRPIDPIYMRKVREIQTETDKLTGVKVSETVDEYYIYSESEHTASITTTQAIDMGVKIAPEAIATATSGIMDATRTKVLSHLHKSIKLVNQLRMLEDALVIYRISRAPERRIFYIDVGNLPKGKAEEYVRNMMSQYRNKIVYDSTSGEVRDDRRHKSMLEDFWLPRREGGRGTEITTLPGGENLGQIDDILFFQKKLYKSLNVPLSRLESDTGFNVGRATEINREEVKFQKFIDRLRNRFSYIFLNALETQLKLKGIIAEDDWQNMKEDISIDFIKDNYFSELKEFEVMKDRVEMANDLQDYVGKYYSQQWIRKNIFGQSEDEIDQIDKQIADEGKEGEEEQDDVFSSTDLSLEDEIDNQEVSELEDELEVEENLERVLENLD
tara:strand:- start:637 stop:2271 length:1635 start_codon:yes stop_codon:yes gene_type:complete